MEREEELSVICKKAVVNGKGRDQSTERRSVHDEEQTAENGALRNTTISTFTFAAVEISGGFPVNSTLQFA